MFRGLPRVRIVQTDKILGSGKRDTYVLDHRHCKNGAKHRRASQKRDDDGDEVAKQIDESEKLSSHAYNRQTEEDQAHTTEKEYRRLRFSFLKEEPY